MTEDNYYVTFKTILNNVWHTLLIELELTVFMII